MSRKGKDFERAYEWLYNLDENKFKVTSPAYVFDKVAKIKREIDVLIEYEDNDGSTKKIGIECRDRKEVADVTWIEQLIQKKKDVGLDYYIATTTRHFSKAMILKAKYYGIFIETADKFDRNFLENISDEFYLENHYAKCSLKNVLLLDNNKIIDLKSIVRKLNIFEIEKLKKILNIEYYRQFTILKEIEDAGIKSEDFYTSNKSVIIKCILNINESNELNILINKGIKMIYMELEVEPVKYIVPLTKHLSTFWEKHQNNKDYIGRFEQGDAYLEIGYLYESKKIFFNEKLPEQKDFRYLGSSMHINTIFPWEYDKEHKIIGEIETVFGNLHMQDYFNM